MNNFDSIEKVDRYLSRIPKFQKEGSFAADFKISRLKRFCDFLGNPEQSFKSVHVAGTNGKGSTCQILGSIFHKAGYKTAVYTSPHLLHFNERFKINGTVIPDEKLVHFFHKYSKSIEEFKLTYFEISTAIAFWYFAQSKVDLAVIETGLGGRLDATNIIDPMISVITSISLDHTDILGETIEEIAREKAGIIKPSKPVVIGDLPLKARDEIYNIAEQKVSNVYTINKTLSKFINPGLYKLTVEGEKILIRTNLAAPVQAKNIAVAWQVKELLREEFPVSKVQFTNALDFVDLGAGRFTRLTQKQPWYFDGGHNMEAVKAMKQTIRAIGSVDQTTLVLAMMRDKLKPGVMNEFSEFKKIYYHYLDFERAATFEEIKHWLPQANPFPIDRDEQQLFFKDFESELVIFAGSFYFYATVRDRIKNFSLNR